LFVIAAFVAIAFTVGRITAPDHSGSPVIAPTVSVSSPAGAPGVPCRVGHPC